LGQFADDLVGPLVQAERNQVAQVLVYDGLPEFVDVDSSQDVDHYFATLKRGAEVIQLTAHKSQEFQHGGVARDQQGVV